MKKLSLLSGVVSDLQIRSGCENSVFTNRDKNIAGAAAIGAVLTEQLDNAPALASVSGGSEISMEGFTSIVEGNFLSGRFHKVEFNENEIIDFVIEHTANRIEVHAARSERQRIIWMLPHHVRGHEAQKNTSAKCIVIVSSFAGLFQAGLMFYVTSGKYSWHLSMVVLVVFAVVFLICSLIARRFNKFSRDTTSILGVLEFAEPANVDLNRVSKTAEAKLQGKLGSLLPLPSTWSYRF